MLVTLVDPGPCHFINITVLDAGRDTVDEIVDIPSQPLQVHFINEILYLRRQHVKTHECTC